ncbi:MAG: hypothetical protein EAZ25_17440 [Oscillatoriales cyanobacterium]|nr:MAG: hypothetical protein EAZ25_17440 [Oscillatoriales cyanobacterium]
MSDRLTALKFVRSADLSPYYKPFLLYSQFPIPNSQFPIPNSQFPIPNSQFPIPNSQFPPHSLQNCYNSINSYLYFDRAISQIRPHRIIHARLFLWRHEISPQMARCASK